MDGKFSINVREKEVCPILNPYAIVMTVLWKDLQIKILREITVRVKDLSTDGRKFHLLWDLP